MMFPGFQPGEHTYQWLRDGVAIPGATALTYKITAEDQGHTLVLSPAIWYDTHVYSNAVAVPAAAGVELKQLTNVTKPVVTGDAVTGSVMKVSAGTWSVPSDKLTFTYNWLVLGRDGNGQRPDVHPGQAPSWQDPHRPRDRLRPRLHHRPGKGHRAQARDRA